LFEVERLLPGTELHFHRPARAIDRRKLLHRRLIRGQVGEHEVPAVPHHAVRTGFDTALPGFLAPLGVAGGDHRRFRPYGHQTALPALRTHGGFEIEDVPAKAFEVVFEAAALLEYDVGRKWQAGEPESSAPFDLVELREAEVAHVPQDEIARANFGDEVLAD